MGLPQVTQNSEMNIDRKDMGKADTLRYNVVVYVVEENYDKAIQELKNFLEKDFEYPNFKERIERYILHAVDLVNAIRAKRKFPGIHSLTIAKQQEITDRFHEHFNELQFILKKIENTQERMKMEDVRSTVWVIKSIVAAVLSICILAFVIEGSRGLIENTVTVVDDSVISSLDWVFKKLNI